MLWSSSPVPWFIGWVLSFSASPLSIPLSSSPALFSALISTHRGSSCFAAALSIAQLLCFLCFIAPLQLVSSCSPIHLAPSVLANSWAIVRFASYRQRDCVFNLSFLHKPSWQLTEQATFLSYDAAESTSHRIYPSLSATSSSSHIHFHRACSSRGPSYAAILLGFSSSASFLHAKLQPRWALHQLRNILALVSGWFFCGVI